MYINYDKYFEADSTSIDTVYYDTPTSTLVVKFNNGSYAGYARVPVIVYNSLATASSVGQSYNSLVRGMYSGVKVDGLTERQQQQYQDSRVTDKPKFKVVAEITGDVTLEVNASDLADALVKAKEQIEKAFAGEVKVNFKGVNVV